MVVAGDGKVIARDIADRVAVLILGDDADLD
jgi:hypothetical protein